MSRLKTLQSRVYEKKIDAWNHVSADLNAASPSLPALESSAIKKKVESLRKDYRKKQRADRSATGTNDSETQLDELIRTVDEMKGRSEISVHVYQKNDINGYREEIEHDFNLTMTAVEAERATQNAFIKKFDEDRIQQGESLVFCQNFRQSFVETTN
ncbi:hypothetical protein G6F56_011825 [Rhizopus delemar]|nr:hypothetical protein G6F56_011825 [Rhizopus delemar]